MKVLSPQCAQRHSFKGWFGSGDEFQSQFALCLVECPLCADKAVVKMPSAPRLNSGGHAPPSTVSEQPSAPASVGTPAVSDTELSTGVNQIA